MIITDEEFNEISLKLNEWLKERHLSKELQQENLTANILEELTEMARSKDAYEMADAACDIAVFVLNSYDIEFGDFILNEDYPSIEEITWYVMNSLLEEDPRKIVVFMFEILYALGLHPVKAMHETIKEISSRTGSYNETIGKFIKNPGFYSVEAAKQAYPNSSIEDCGDTIEVWESDKECLVFKKWYKADYKKCIKAKEQPNSKKCGDLANLKLDTIIQLLERK